MIKKLVAVVSLVLWTGASQAFSDLVLLQEDYQVLQRDAQDQASCVVPLGPQATQADAYLIKLQDAQGKILRVSEAKPSDVRSGGKGIAVEHLAVGGQYTVTISAKGDQNAVPKVLQHILVGDLWILGGQSNMFGIDVIKEDLPALPFLNMLNALHIEKVGHWCAGLPPIHRIPPQFDPFVLKSQHPEYSQEQIDKFIADKTPVGGIDGSYFFARKLHADSGVPIGVIPCAIGGALAIWDPDKRDENRYGFMHGHVMRAGGRVKGLLFFQGEQDAIFADARSAVTKPSLVYPLDSYGAQFSKFVETLRKDVGNPDMPVIFAQVCRHHNGSPDRAKGWEIVRDAQRQIPQSLANAHCIPSLDLDVMDGLHLDYESQKRIGERMAYVALPYVDKKVASRSEIKLKSVSYSAAPRPAILVEFTGVTGKLRAAGRPTGFCMKKKESGEVVDWIYKVDFDPARPNLVILRVTTAPTPDVHLYYGAGTAPYVNIVDQNDMSVPAFGPIEVK